jgi:Arc/MetJ-type ribon-helix-helix transcriptional regulator
MPHKEISMSDTEKITINLGAVDLGKIDLLVEHGHYSNRTDFIRTAIRSQLEKHTIDVQQSVLRDSYAIGAVIYSRSDFEKFKAKGEKIKIKIMGMLHLDKDIPADLAVQVVESIKILGIFSASEEVKAALADKEK